MKSNEQQLIKRAKDALKGCLGRLPSVKVDSIEKLADADFLVRLITSSGTRKVIVEVKSSGQPRIVRGAVGSLLRIMRNYPSAYGVIAAPYISPESAKICEDENMGFVDFVGNCHLCFESIFIERSGQPRPAAIRREHKSLFTQKASRMLRVLFQNPKEKWRIAQLAKEAGVSLGQAFNVKELLLNQELIAITKEGISLPDPDVLLGMWAVAYVSRKNWVDFFTLKSPAEFEAELATFCIKKKIPYAFMGFSAAARYAPSVRSNRAMAYVSTDVYEIAQKLGLKTVPSGANVTLAFPSDDGIYYGSQEIDGMKIVSPLQTYLDLVGARGRARRYGRGDEAAQMILEKKVRPTW